MRILEILILVTLLPTLVGFFFPTNRRPRWLAFLPGVALLFFIFHLIVEGYRSQMIPAYALTAILLLPTIRIIIRRVPQSEPASEAPSRRRKAVAVFGVLFFVVAAALPALFPVFRLPEPTGPYAVGTTSFHFVDTSREELLTADPTDHRELVVQAWYPAESSPAGKPSVYMEHPPFLLDHLSLVPTHSYPDAPISSDQPLYPVLIFSHGYALSLITQNTVQMEEFASHGYIVFSIGHPFDALTTVYPDGRIVPLDSARFRIWGQTTSKLSSILPAVTTSNNLSEKEALLRQVLAGHLVGDELTRLWTSDTIFVMDELERINAGAQDSLLAGKLDLERLGVFGHSLGGATAGQVCLVDPRCKAGINMDGIPWGDVIDHNLERPFMFMYSEPPGFKGMADPIYERAANAAYRITIRGTAHANYSEIPLWVRIRVPMVIGSIDAQRAITIIRDYTLAFFDKHLKNIDSPLLGGPSPDYPEVDFASRNP